MSGSIYMWKALMRDTISPELDRGKAAQYWPRAQPVEWQANFALLVRSVRAKVNRAQDPAWILPDSYR